MRTSSSTAVWNGTLAQGTGEFRAESGAFDAAYSHGTRFGDQAGTNPEELLAAAHAACLSMALAAGLAREGHEPERIRTRASATIEQGERGFQVTRMRLEVRGKVPGLGEKEFAKAAEGAKTGCPISNALAGNVELELDARLET